jgi:hypothetical protein
MIAVRFSLFLPCGAAVRFDNSDCHLLAIMLGGRYLRRWFRLAVPKVCNKDIVMYMLGRDNLLCFLTPACFMQGSLIEDSNFMHNEGFNKFFELCGRSKRDRQSLKKWLRMVLSRCGGCVARCLWYKTRKM